MTLAADKPPAPPHAHPHGHAHAHAYLHAQALAARGSALPAEGPPGPVVLDSWVRCMQAGLDARAAVVVPVVDGSDLQRRRQRSEVVRRLAQAELENLSRQIAGSNFLLAFADRDGVILDLVADNRFSMSGKGAGIVAGSCWREDLAGTNGLGTALASGAPVAVTGLEHYFLSLGDVSCTAAPVRDARGDIVGVLDASSYFESRQRHTQALVQMGATHIENGLLLHQMRRHWVLAVHPRPEFLGTLGAGLLAFDEGGRLQAANARARQLLQGLDVQPGTSFDALFGEPCPAALARLQRTGELRLRDAMGSTLAAMCMNRPPQPALLPRAAASPSSAASSVQPAPGWLAAEAALPAASRPPASRAAQAGPAATAAALPAIVADDPAVAAAFALAAAAARRGVPLLLCGETGSGKEMLARHAHAQSGRRGAFVAVNCGALPGELIEAELFGYVGGAFSGARREGSPGLIASADGGTLLLDEVRELPLHLQAALLRFLDDRQVRPVGGTRSRAVDVLLLAATHADLDAEVAARRFRADLLYRLNTVRVDLPPLRQRRDFAAAVRSVLASVDARASVDDAAVALLARHHWPGNFRELRSVLTRALLHGDEHGRTQEGHPAGRHDESRAGRRLDTTALAHWLPARLAPAAASVLQQGAAELIQREYERCGTVSATARALGISRTTVYRHLRLAS